jgi:Zn-dependent peptidase ImmA (M78 family)
MNNFSIQAPALSKAQIEDIAWRIRLAVGLDNRKDFPVVRFMELILPQVQGFEEFEYEIVDSHEMAGTEGFTHINEKKIVLPREVYDGACNNDGRSRFTIAHELCHLFLHPKDRLSLNRSTANVPAYKDVEWQANTFAGCILMPKTMILACSSLDEIVKEFVVSQEAAEVRATKCGTRLNEFC